MASAPEIRPIDDIRAATASGSRDSLWNAIVAATKTERPAPAVAQCVLDVAIDTDDDRLLKALCFDVLAHLLEDVYDESSADAVEYLTSFLEGNDSRHMRRRVMRTLAYIGRAACPALATITDNVRAHRGSIRVKARGANHWISHCGLNAGNEREQMRCLDAPSRMPAFKYYFERIESEYELQPRAKKRFDELLQPAKDGYTVTAMHPGSRKVQNRRCESVRNADDIASATVCACYYCFETLPTGGHLQLHRSCVLVLVWRTFAPNCPKSSSRR